MSWVRYGLVLDWLCVLYVLYYGVLVERKLIKIY